jgi:hypothetical protein
VWLLLAGARLRGGAVTWRDVLVKVGIVIVCAVAIIAAWNMWGG